MDPHRKREINMSCCTENGQTDEWLIKHFFWDWLFDYLDVVDKTLGAKNHIGFLKYYVW